MLRPIAADDRPGVAVLCPMGFEICARRIAVAPEAPKRAPRPGGSEGTVGRRLRRRGTRVVRATFGENGVAEVA